MQGQQREEYEASQKPYDCLTADKDTVRIHLTYIHTHMHTVYMFYVGKEI